MDYFHFLRYYYGYMAIATSQQITRYYNEYLHTEITFTKSIMKVLNMDPRQIYLKCAGSQWPCIINSTSFAEAKVIIGTKGGAFQQIAQIKSPSVNIRFCFYQSETQMLSFFISGKVTDITPYANSKELAVVTVAYTQRPPDDLIEMIGRLLDANNNAIRRKEERITINEDTCRKIGLTSEKTIITISNVPRHCILRDISFSGAKVVLVGLGNFLVNKDIVLRMEFEEPHEIFNIKGQIKSTGHIEDRKDICTASIAFDENSVTIPYKVHINNYLTSTRKENLRNFEENSKKNQN